MKLFTNSLCIILFYFVHIYREKHPKGVSIDKILNTNVSLKYNKRYFIHKQNEQLLIEIVLKLLDNELELTE